VPVRALQPAQRWVESLADSVVTTKGCDKPTLKLIERRPETVHGQHIYARWRPVCRAVATRSIEIERGACFAERLEELRGQSLPLKPTSIKCGARCAAPAVLLDKSEVDMAITSRQAFVGLGRFLYRELREAWPVFLYFLAGFLLLLVLVKLVLAEFSIKVMALSNAVVGALLAAKTVLILDETPLARSLERYRRVVAVAVKTFLYEIAGLLFGYAERFVDALHKVHSFAAASEYVVDHANHYRLLAWALGISIVFAHYFSFF
jgi:hypothetical protein